jgi:predicted metal-binding membrane protein
MGMFRIAVPPGVERTALIVSVGLLAAGAWLALWLGEDSASAFLSHSGHLGHMGKPSALFVLIFITGWTVMTVAMMLPTSLPILTTFQTLARERADRALLLALVIAGYLLTWALFGAIVYLVYLLLQHLMTSFPWFQRYAWAGRPALLLLAGAFQFSSLKYRCLDKCRSPLSFVLGHWQGRQQRWQAFRLGVDHGLFCVGCCWALMLLMFVVGVGNSLAWMFVLAVVMGVEKNVSWGRRMSAPVGIVLIGWGAILLALAR